MCIRDSHRSGTITIEVSHVTFYTFTQQMRAQVGVAKILSHLSDAESNRAFGWYRIETEPQLDEINSKRVAKTEWLNQFLNQIIERIEPRFQQQCRDILDWCDNNPKTG